MLKRKNTSNDSSKNAKKPAMGAHWKLGLLEAIKDPKLFVKSDNLVNIIKDKYPKAKYHYLIIPKENIPDLKSLTSEHSPLLKHMEQTALDLIKEKHKNVDFKLGYHAKPSMSPLHLHVISTDMCSDCLKTKRHWNSFVTEFFIESNSIRKTLEENGKISLPLEKYEKFLKTPLKCHKCEYTPKNMPDLKKHILSHLE